MKNKTKNKENLEVLIDSFKTEVGKFLLKKLMFNWYSVSELSKLWIPYKNKVLVFDEIKGVNQSIKDINLKISSKVKEKINIKRVKTNPRISKLVELWHNNGLLVKAKVKKEVERMRNGKVHLYPSFVERYKLNTSKVFVLCIKYFLEQRYEMRINYYSSQKQLEKEKYIESLKEIENLENELNTLLEEDEIKNVLFFWWKFEFDGSNILQLIENFLENWKNISKLRNFLPEKFEKLLRNYKSLDEVVKKLIENSNYFKLLSCIGGKRVLESFEPEVKLIAWFLLNPKNFLKYYFLEDKLPITASDKLYHNTLLFLDILNTTPDSNNICS